MHVLHIYLNCFQLAGHSQEEFLIPPRRASTNCNGARKCCNICQPTNEAPPVRGGGGAAAEQERGQSGDVPSRRDHAIPFRIFYGEG